MIYLNRRNLLNSLGVVALTTALPMLIPKSATKAKVVCETTFQGKQYVVFDDNPTSIFVFEDDGSAFQFKAGQEYFV